MLELRAGLVGDGIGPSLTPDVHMAEGRALGLTYTYERFDTERSGTLASALSMAQAEGYAGLNITHPHKQAVVGHLDQLEGVAAQIRTVNTVVFQNDQSVGWNTDYYGFKKALGREIGSVEGQTVQVFGAGGAGLAVVLALLDSGVAQIVISDLDHKRSEALVSDVLSIRPEAVLEAVPPLAATPSVDGLVNCTPMGMANHPGIAADPAHYGHRCWAADIVYFPKDTEFVKRARAAGMRVMDGTGMALWQAVEAFRLITGHAPDTMRMKATLQELLSQNGEIAAQ